MSRLTETVCAIRFRNKLNVLLPCSEHAQYGMLIPRNIISFVEI